MITTFNDSYRNYPDMFYSTPSDNQQVSTIRSENVVSEKRKQETADINFSEISAKRTKLKSRKVTNFKNESKTIFHKKNKQNSSEKKILLDKIEETNNENIPSFLQENLENIINLSYYGGRNTNKVIYDMIIGWSDKDHQKIVVTCLLGISSLAIISFLDYLRMYSKTITDNDIRYLKNGLSNESEDKKKLLDHVNTLNRTAKRRGLVSYSENSSPELKVYDSIYNFQTAQANNLAVRLNTSTLYTNNLSSVPVFDNYEHKACHLTDVAVRMPYPKNPIYAHSPKINPLNLNPIEPELHSMPNKHFSLQHYQQISQSSYQNVTPYRHPYEYLNKENDQFFRY